MCDTMVALHAATAAGIVLFGKNSDRERNEAQAIELHPAAEHDAGAVLQATRIRIPQAGRTRAVLISRPCWMWGAEMGANDAGVVIGNEAVHSTHAPAREAGLLGMDLLRLGLERAGSAAEACGVITALLAAHGQGGDSGHLNPHFYHNSFLLADAAEAFVLETVGRDWVVEPAAGVRTISNAYATPAMRAHADTALEAIGDGPSRSARSAALLGAGPVDVLGMMAALRDHGAQAGPGWHPAQTVGRTICMHAGAGPRRSQTVASMVSELRQGGALHWMTGTSAPCTSVFKPVCLAAGSPPAGPAPTDRMDAATLWWRHEKLHRALLRDAGGLPAWLIAERDALEAGFVQRTRGDVNDTLVARCWAEAAAAEAGWAARLGVPDSAPDAEFLASWDALSALATQGQA